MQPHQVDLSRFRLALISLGNALDPPPANDRERDGAIQRFEFTFELAWKTSARLLGAYGVTAQSPRTTFRELAAQGWLATPEIWFDFLELRNQTVHSYNDIVANKIFVNLAAFCVAAQSLFKLYEQLLHA